MQHWMRKHVDEIDWVAGQCAKAVVLPAWQEAFLKKVKSLAFAVRHGEKTCSPEHVCEMITMLCSACRGGLPEHHVAECKGRRDWAEPCDLVRKVLFQDAA